MGFRHAYSSTHRPFKGTKASGSPVCRQWPWGFVLAGRACIVRDVSMDVSMVYTNHMAILNKVVAMLFYSNRDGLGGQ